jgi:hypothetical protein
MELVGDEASWRKPCGGQVRQENPALANEAEITSADGGWCVLFAIIAQWPAAVEFFR